MSTTTPGRDEERLAELGYKQELTRAWSGFSNFAISFTIISILAGCFTTYGQAWNNGGPIAISIGWPLISGMILLVAFCMSELVSAYPTAGGIYWWASELGGAVWGWFTGWFNLVGLVAVVASVDYACATFISTLLSLWSLDLGVINFADGAGLGDIFTVFLAVLVLHALINIYSSHMVALFNNVSVWWHVPASARSWRSSSSARNRTRACPSSSPRRSTTPASATACSGSTCCRSGSCSRSTRSPASTRRRTSPRRPTARRRPHPRACGARCSTRR